MIGSAIIGCQPIFRTKRLILRPRRQDDTDACLAMDCMPGVLDFVELPAMSDAEHRAFIQERTRGPWPPGMGYWTILPVGDPTSFLGWVLLIPEDGKGPAIEIGWRLVPEAWGRGIATEAACPLVEYGFGSLGLAAIDAVIHADNHASRRVAEKIGMQHAARVESKSGATGLRYRVMQGRSLPAG